MRFIGSKYRLLQSIDDFLSSFLDGDEKTFCDLFAGTNCVGKYFKNRYQIISNDTLFFSYLNSLATLSINIKPEFRGLAKVGISDPLEFLSQGAERYLEKKKIGYYELSYSPTGGAMYFTTDNAKRIDFIRSQIQSWSESNYINNIEEAYLVSALIEAIPYISNITGTYGAYLKQWDKRALNPLHIVDLDIPSGHRGESFNIDSNELVKQITPDITYIDIPYNQRQYASNYHVLENIAKNDKPVLRGKTKIFDWKQQRSLYSQSRSAHACLFDLIKNVQSKHIVLSYNSQGLLSRCDIEDILKQFSYDGNVVVREIQYRRYASKSTSGRNEVSELLFYIRKTPPSKLNKDNVVMKSNFGRVYTISNREILIKSPVNYIGGKYKLLPQILPLFPKDIDCFVDLFCGGINVGINVEAKQYVFNDMNTRLIEMFEYFKNTDIEVLLDQIHLEIQRFGLSKSNESAYLSYRKRYNSNPNPLMLYVLSCFGYNYQLRFNNQMEFNNPFGRERSSFNPRMESNLRKFVNKLQTLKVDFHSEYFECFNYDSLKECDFIYLDPPYLITTGSYNDGNRGFKGWGFKEESELLELLVNFDKSNIKFALSNVITHKGRRNELLFDFIRSHSFNVHHLNYGYENSSHNTTRTHSDEVLITNY